MPSKKSSKKPPPKQVNVGSKYKVGYGKPPKQHQWQPGQSGNSEGKKKGNKSLKTIVQEEVNGKVIVKQNGQTKEVTKLHALILRLYAKAQSGDLKSMIELIKLAKEYVDDHSENEAETLTEDELAILENHEAFLAFLNEVRNDYDIEPEDGSV